MLMNEDQVSAPVRGEQMLCRRATQQPPSGVEGGSKVQRGGTLSPVFPEDPRVYGGRTPAASPKPSSRMPGNYCFSPFGCPAREEKGQISSLGTKHRTSRPHLLLFVQTEEQRQNAHTFTKITIRKPRSVKYKSNPNIHKSRKSILHSQWNIMNMSNI